MMKKVRARVATAMAEPMVGSPTGACGGIDISALYIDMLCERFKNRGIKSGLSEAKSAEIRRNAEMLGLEIDGVSAYDEKYRTMRIDGKSYMSSDDFAAYYKDLRGYKMPHFYSRAEKEYDEAEAGAKNVQESGKPPKKALWLAIKRRTKDTALEFVNGYIVNEARKQVEEEVVEGKKKRFPRGVIPTLAAVTLSLLLIVCSAVMVSRASREVSILEDDVEELMEVRDDLATVLEVKNNMLDIKRVAIEEFNMISREYAKSVFIDVKEDEKIVLYDKGLVGESFIRTLLKAIGLIGD